MRVCRYLSKAMETQPVLSADCAVNNSKGLFPHSRKAKDFHENEILKKKKLKHIKSRHYHSHSCRHRLYFQKIKRKSGLQIEIPTR